MDKDLLVDGKNYISAIRASKRIGYTSDYIGQLCRSGKVPGKLIGRSWYVDFDVLLAHKKGNKVRKNKKTSENKNFIDKPKSASKKVFENFFAETSEYLEKKFEPVKEKQPSIATLSYLPDYGSRLPELKKTKIEAAVIDPKRTKTAFTTLVLIMLMIVSVYTAGYVRYTAIHQSNTKKDFGAAGLLSGIFNKFFNKNEKAIVTPANEGKFGIVALPEKEGEHASIVLRVKRAFSDEVKVQVDPEGDAGVITPVFREGDDTENYAFVMVPIKEQ